jgi:pimeloyl-ACP methyl ester carboxylesterase
MRRSWTRCLFLIPILAATCFAVTPKEGYADFEGNKVFYLDAGKQGKKEAIVLIHGWTCNSSFWKDSIEAFPEYRVIAVDLIGHGKSDKPQANYSMEYFARSVDAVLKKANVERAVLVGHSMGTPVARQFYRLYPKKTLGIVIVDGAVKAFADEATMKGFAAPLRANYSEGITKFLDGMLAPVQDAKLKDFIRQSMSSTPGYVALSAWDGMADMKIWTDDKIDVPVLAIMAPSPYWPPNVKDIFAATAPKIDFQMWSGVSHFLMMEKPKEFNSAVKSYIEKNKLL